MWERESVPAPSGEGVYIACYDCTSRIRDERAREFDVETSELTLTSRVWI